MLSAGQRVVVASEGGGCAQHSVGHVRAQMCAVGSIGRGHPVQGAGTARIGKVHPAVHQVLCMGREVSQRGPQTVTGHVGQAVALGVSRAALRIRANFSNYQDPGFPEANKLYKVFQACLAPYCPPPEHS